MAGADGTDNNPSTEFTHSSAPLRSRQAALSGKSLENLRTSSERFNEKRKRARVMRLFLHLRLKIYNLKLSHLRRCRPRLLFLRRFRRLPNAR